MQPAQEPDPGPRRHRRGLFVVLLAFCLVAIGYGGVALATRLSWRLLPGNGVRLPKAVAGLPYLDVPTAAPAARINILILGVDYRQGEGDEYTRVRLNDEDDDGRSDTMAVFSIDPASKTASVLSIPRDLWVEVPDGHGGWTMDRIDEAYHTGAENKLPGGGPAAAAAAVTRDFGIPIDHYVVLDFTGFMTLIDALGGITLDVPQTLTATVLPADNAGGYEYTFLAGRQHLSGELALAYSRFRYDAEGDFGRIARQQQVALAARDKALSLGWAAQALTLWGQYHQAVQTDLQAYEMPGYALLAKQVEGRAVATYSLGETDATAEAILAESGADVLLPNRVRMAEIVTQAFGDQSLGEAALQSLQRQYPVPIRPIGTTASGVPIIHAPVEDSSAVSRPPRPLRAR